MWIQAAFKLPLPSASTSDAAAFGAAAPPTDVDTAGSSPEIDAQAATTAPEDWTQNPYVQIEGGFLAGVSLGLVPLGGVGHQLADAGEVLPHGTPEARFGLAVGQVVGGIASMAGGMAGGLLGGATTATGAGAPVGVPAMVVSTTLVIGGAANVAAGIWGLTQSMMSKGSGTTGSQGTTPTTEGGVKLTGGGKKVLRDPALQAMKDKTLREGILDRGGGGAVVRKAGDLADRTIGEIANAAALGDEASVKAIKLLKDAARLGGKNYGQ
jgi:hypothetical protein